MPSCDVDHGLFGFANESFISLLRGPVCFPFCVFCLSLCLHSDRIMLLAISSIWSKAILATALLCVRPCICTEHGFTAAPIIWRFIIPTISLGIVGQKFGGMVHASSFASR